MCDLQSRVFRVIAYKAIRDILKPCSYVKESQTLPTSKVSNEMDGMQGTEALKLIAQSGGNAKERT